MWAASAYWLFDRRVELQQVTPEAHTSSIRRSMPGCRQPNACRVEILVALSMLVVVTSRMAASCVRRETCWYRFAQLREVLPQEAQ